MELNTTSQNNNQDNDIKNNTYKLSTNKPITAYGMLLNTDNSKIVADLYGINYDEHKHAGVCKGEKIGNIELTINYDVSLNDLNNISIVDFTGLTNENDNNEQQNDNNYVASSRIDNVEAEVNHLSSTIDLLGNNMKYIKSIFTKQDRCNNIGRVSKLVSELNKQMYNNKIFYEDFMHVYDGKFDDVDVIELFNNVANNKYNVANDSILMKLMSIIKKHIYNNEIITNGYEEDIYNYLNDVDEDNKDIENDKYIGSEKINEEKYKMITPSKLSILSSLYSTILTELIPLNDNIEYISRDINDSSLETKLLGSLDIRTNITKDKSQYKISICVNNNEFVFCNNFVDNIITYPEEEDNDEYKIDVDKANGIFTIENKYTNEIYIVDTRMYTIQYGYLVSHPFADEYNENYIGDFFYLPTRFCDKFAKIINTNITANKTKNTYNEIIIVSKNDEIVSSQKQEENEIGELLNICQKSLTKAQIAVKDISMSSLYFPICLITNALFEKVED